MADFTEAKTRFTTKDKITPSFRDMDRGAKRFGRSASKSFRDATSSATRFGTVTKGILAAGIVQRGISGLTQGLRGLTSEFVSFDDSITAASAKFTDVNLLTRKGQLSFEALRKAARKTGAETEFSATQSAAALDFLAIAGFNSVQAMASLPAVVDLATAGNLDLATATDIASDSLGAFGLMTKDSIQLQKNLTRINDVFAKAATTANLTVEQLFETVKQGAPDFVNAGQSMETFAALAGIMAGSGIKAEKAGVQLRNAIVNLSATTPAADAALKKLGVTVEDNDGKFRDVVDVFEDLQKGLKNVKSDTARTSLVTDIFGKRSSGLKVLLSANIDELREYRRSLIDSGGAAATMAAIMRKSLGNQLKTLTSATIELGFKFFEAFKVQGEGAILAITKAVRNFDPAPMIEGMRIALDIFKGLWTVLKPFVPFMPWFIGTWIAFGVTMKILAFANMASNFLLFWNAIRKVAGGMAILNAVMAANPVGAIILGVAALIGLLILVVKNWDKIKAVMKTFISDFSAGMRIIMTKVGDLLKRFINPLSSGIRTFVEFFGGDKEEANRQPERAGPNREEAEARQGGTFKGRIDIAGAPAGTTVESESTGAPDIDMGLLN